MFFKGGKRKANASIEIIDARTKKKTYVNLSSPISLQNVQSEGTKSGITELYNINTEGISEANIVDQNLIFEDSSGSEYDNDLEDKGVQRTYKKRRERLSSNWEKIRLKLLKTSLALEGLLPSTCSEATCQESAETRCRDCGFATYYCRKCCDKIHRDKLQFHGCQILKVSAI